MGVTIMQGDVREQLRTLPSASVQAVICSPPYFRLRSYLPASHPDKHLEIGSEPTPAEFVAALVAVFEEVKRVMRPDGVLFVNLADSYAGSGKGYGGGSLSERRGTHEHVGKNPTPQIEGVRPKSLFLIPQRFAIAMQDAGWIVRDEIVWAKKSAMPESVRDRCTKAWEPIFMFTKSGRYFWDQTAIRQPASESTMSDKRIPESNPPGWSGNPRANGGAQHNPMASGSDGANLRNVWHLSPEPSKEQHWASFPTEIPRRCILAASRPGDTVLDPFAGTGTTLMVADRLGRNAVGIELNGEYVEIMRRRLTNDAPMFADVAVS